MDVADHATQNIACARKRDVFVVQLAMVACITVTQTMKNSCPCSIIRLQMSDGGLINDSCWWIGSSGGYCVGGYLVVDGWLDLVVAIGGWQINGSVGLGLVVGIVLEDIWWLMGGWI